jgi:hypothetical protein
MNKKLLAIILYILPILIMIGLIPLVTSDFMLAVIYLVFIVVLMSVKREKNDWTVLLFGLIGMTISEYLFIHTGVESFLRKSLFGLMPLWLPLLWAYAFVTIKRSLRIL